MERPVNNKTKVNLETVNSRILLANVSLPRDIAIPMKARSAIADPLRSQNRRVRGEPSVGDLNSRTIREGRENSNRYHAAAPTRSAIASFSNQSQPLSRTLADRAVIKKSAGTNLL